MEFIVHSILWPSEVKVNDGKEALTHDPPLEIFDKNAVKHSHKKIQRRADFLTILETNKPPTINEKIFKISKAIRISETAEFLKI